MPKQETFRDAMEERFGDDYNRVFIQEEKVMAVSTGSPSLDICIGIGGVPRKRLTLIEGAEGSGKTTFGLSICRSVLRMGEKALYIDVENQMDFDSIQELLGETIDQDRFILAKPGNSDDAFVIIETALSSNEFGVIVLDSVAGLSPPEEKKKKFEDSTVAIIPRDLASFFRRNVDAIRNGNTALVFINQVRDQIGSYVKTYSSPGGHALKHFSSVTIFLSKAETIKAGEAPIGIMTKFTIKKNKHSPPFRTFMVPIIFGKGIDTTRDLISYAEALGVIRKAGAYYKFEDLVIGRGMLNAMDYLVENEEVLEKVIQMCYNTLGRTNQAIAEPAGMDKGDIDVAQTDD